MAVTLLRGFGSSAQTGGAATGRRVGGGGLRTPEPVRPGLDPRASLCGDPDCPGTTGRAVVAALGWPVGRGEWARKTRMRGPPRTAVRSPASGWPGQRLRVAAWRRNGCGGGRGPDPGHGRIGPGWRRPTLGRRARCVCWGHRRRHMPRGPGGDGGTAPVTVGPPPPSWRAPVPQAIPGRQSVRRPDAPAAPSGGPTPSPGSRQRSRRPFPPSGPLHPRDACQKAVPAGS